jgi:hypothetical protein
MYTWPRSISSGGGSLLRVHSGFPLEFEGKKRISALRHSGQTAS